MRRAISALAALAGLGALGAVSVDLLSGPSPDRLATVHAAAPTTAASTVFPTPATTVPITVAATPPVTPPAAGAATAPTTAHRPASKPVAPPAPPRTTTTAAASILGPWQPLPGNAPTGPTQPAAPPPTAPTIPAGLGMGSASSYTFEKMNPDGTPAHWDPCQPIYYQISSYLLVPGSLSEFQQAVADVSAATGVKFVYEGETAAPADMNWKKAPPDPTGQPPVLLGWMPANQGPMANGGDLMGATAVDFTAVPDTTGYYDIATGAVALNVDDQLPAGFGVSSEGVVILHELGHLMGLGHTPDPAQIMHPGVDGQPGRYAAGDLTGLSELGHGACMAPGPYPS